MAERLTGAADRKDFSGSVIVVKRLIPVNTTAPAAKAAVDAAAPSTGAVARGAPAPVGTDAFEGVKSWVTQRMEKAGLAGDVTQLPAVQALLKEVEMDADLSIAQAIVQQARKAALQRPAAEIDAEHAAVAAKPVPQKPEEMAAVLLDRLKIGGDQRDLVMKAVKLVLAGHVPPRNWQSIGGPESMNAHTHSTQMAVTDEGPDHLMMTLADPRMVNVAWSHMERINRVDEHGKATTDAFPYALPPEQLAGLTRLFLGNDAPSTMFYGTPNYRPSAVSDAVPQGMDEATAALHNNPFEAIRDLQMVARRAFSMGFSEVKVSMDGLPPAEAEKFMKAVTKPLRLEPGQFVSMAFNLNKALKDFGMGDAISGVPSPADRLKLAAVAHQAVEVAARGGGGKVTLDSSSMTPPSFPLIEFFGVENLLTFAHEAHEQGLETYVSAGMQAYHFPLLAMTGVDGVGVGTSIHEATNTPGILGRMVPSRVLDALDRRDKTEASWPGEVIYLLRRVDERASQLEDAAELSDTDKFLQGEAFSLLQSFARGIDAKLDVMKADRDAKLTALAGQKATMPADEFTTQSKAIGDEFKAGFEKLVAESLADPDFVSKCKALAETGVKAGYALRGNPEGQG